MAFQRDVERKAAEQHLLTVVLAYKQSKYPLWYVIKLLAKMWDHPLEEQVRLDQWDC